MQDATRPAHQPEDDDDREVRAGGQRRPLVHLPEVGRGGVFVEPAETCRRGCSADQTRQADADTLNGHRNAAAARSAHFKVVAMKAEAAVPAMQETMMIDESSFLKTRLKLEPDAATNRGV